MHKVFIYILSGILSVISITATAQNTPVAPDKITASLDTAAVTMGQRATVHVQLLKTGHTGAFLYPLEQSRQQESSQAAATLAGMEVRQVTADSTEMGNDRIQVDYEFLVQPFEPGDIQIPPFAYVAAPGDTITSNVLSIKVLEPEMPQEMRDSLYINPMRGTLAIEAQWYDWVPDWWYWLLLGVVVAGLVVAILLLYKKNGKTILPLRKRVPPYVLATRRLDELKTKRLAEKGHTKAYYTELTDILRQYLGGRFKIYALEMTSPQIIAALKENPETAPLADYLQPMFNTADFVKFAKQDATADENIRSYNTVRNFVEKTRPQEPVETRVIRERIPSTRKKSKAVRRKKSK